MEGQSEGLQAQLPMAAASSSERTAKAALLTAPVYSTALPDGSLVVWERQSDNWVILHGDPAAAVSTHQWSPHQAPPMPPSLAAHAAPTAPVEASVSTLPTPAAASSPRAWLAGVLGPDAEAAIAALASERRNVAWAHLADALDIAYVHQPDAPAPQPLPQENPIVEERIMTPDVPTP